jgi:hypothetical protein
MTSRLANEDADFPHPALLKLSPDESVDEYHQPVGRYTSPLHRIHRAWAHRSRVDATHGYQCHAQAFDFKRHRLNTDVGKALADDDISERVYFPQKCFTLDTYYTCISVYLNT